MLLAYPSSASDAQSPFRTAVERDHPVRFPIATSAQWHTVLPPVHRSMASISSALRPYSSPNCNPVTSTGCPVDGIPVFTDIFAEDTIANSTYNALEMMLQKRFSHGLQFQAAYTFSKSIDDGSTFEETLDPFNYRASRGLSIVQLETALCHQL